MAPTRTDDYTPVYDADAHICEPPTVWTEYCDPQYRDLIIQARTTSDGKDALYANRDNTGTSAAPACIPGAFGTDVTWDDIVPGSYDPAARLKVMDAERLDAALMFPSLDLLTGELRRPDVAAANARAYNRWMVDFVSEDMVCHPFEQMASVMEITASGILDDHPRLRVGFFESGMGWLPYWLDRLDEHKETMGHLVPRLMREPTEIFSEQCFVTMEAGEGEAFSQIADMGLAHTVVWGSDYPHYDCTYPGALAELEDSFERVGRLDFHDEVLYTNARRFMGLN